MATIEGAKALLWDREIGSLEAGKRADIVVADTDGLEWQPRPLENPVANLVYSSSASSVRDVVLDGRVVMEKCQFRGLSLSVFAEQAGKASAADPANGLPAAEVAKAYVKSVEGEATGLIIDARKVHT
jgi:5-methylthioadenosine/S-adenosylhomocysteine deaminase